MSARPAVSLVPSTRATGRDVLLTPAEVGAWLKCSPRQVARLGIACVRLGTRKLTRYPEGYVQSWIDAQLRSGR